MRTLQEKYNAIQEGKFSKDQFLVEARMQQPQLVTRYNGYRDAVQILKNRGMIQESSAEESFADYSNDALNDMIINMSRYEGNEEEITRVKSELQRRKETLEEANLGHNEISSIHQEGGSWIVTYRKDGTKEKVFKTEKEARAFEKTLNEAKLTKKSLTDYRYKPTNDMDKYPYEQILRGLRVELEVLQISGTPTAEEYKKALAKVLKNLEKDSIFYTNQLAGNSKKVDLHDKMVDATAKNTVDTFNGMKKIKDLKENVSSLKNLPDGKYFAIDGDWDEEYKGHNGLFFTLRGINLIGSDGQNFQTSPEEFLSQFTPDEILKVEDIAESTLKEGIKNLIKKALMENEEDIYEMQGPKTDDEYKNDLADYLEGHQIYGYTNKIHNIMTGPDEDEAYRELAEYLDSEGIYGFTRAIERLYADYPYDQHWMNQPDEDEVDDISHPRGYEEASDEESFEDLYEVTDTEADKSMVRKLMAMYEAEPSKFEKLHKQAQVQAATTKDIKFKHLLSLINRAKAGALQSLANQDSFEADREGINEESDDDKLARYRSYTYTLDGEVVSPKIGYYNNYIGAELDGEFLKVGIPSEDGVVQLRYPQGKQGMYTENIFKSVSLKDIL